MIEFIHKYPTAIKILLAVVTLTFVGTGGWIIGKGSEGQYAVKVEDSVISLDDYQKQLSRLEDTYRQVYQGNMPEELKKRLNLPRRALNSLVDKRVLLLEAQKQGVAVSDEELSAAILDLQSFKDDGGNFSKQRYAEILKYNNMTPAVFEREMRQDMIVEKFRKMIKDAVYVPDAQVLDYYKKQLLAQKKDFKDEEFQAQKDGVFRMLTANEQEKTVRSVVEGLRKNYVIEENKTLNIPEDMG